MLGNAPITFYSNDTYLELHTSTTNEEKSTLHRHHPQNNINIEQEKTDKNSLRHILDRLFNRRYPPVVPENRVLQASQMGLPSPILLNRAKKSVRSLILEFEEGTDCDINAGTKRSTAVEITCGPRYYTSCYNVIRYT